MVHTGLVETFFQEVTRYVGFGQADRDALRALHPHAIPHFEAITEEFYARILEHEGARKVLANPEQVTRLQKTLVRWLDTLLTGPWDEDYFKTRARIGRVHVEVRLPQRYMLTAMSVIRAHLIRIAGEAFVGDRAQERASVLALNKLLDVELSIMLGGYHDDYMTLVRRTKELELEHRSRRAEQLVALGTMSAGLAHEIRNPLNAAKLQLLLVERRLSKDDPEARAKAQESAHIVRLELERLAGLVHEFLSYARPGELRVTSGDLRATARAVIDLLAPDAEQSSVELTVVDGLELRAVYDEERIKQVLINLVRNAIQAAAGDGPAQVRVELARVDEDARITVFDTGPGVPEGLDLFAPFETTKEGGTGLGLPICSRIVSDHKGDLRTERRGAETAFIVSIPLAGP